MSFSHLFVDSKLLISTYARQVNDTLSLSDCSQNITLDSLSETYSGQCIIYVHFPILRHYIHYNILVRQYNKGLRYSLSITLLVIIIIILVIQLLLSHRVALLILYRCCSRTKDVQEQSHCLLRHNNPQLYC